MSSVDSVPTSKGWSAEKRLWQELDRLGGHLQWRRVRFEIDREELIPHQSTGVYLICVHPPSTAVCKIRPYTIIYAGQVRSARRGLRRRFLEHFNHPKPRLRPFLKCFQSQIDFWYAATVGSQRINRLEAILIDAFNPPCNAKSAPEAPALRAYLGIPKQFGVSSK